MSDVIADAGAAPAAPEPSAVPINEAPASQSSPIDSSGPERAPEPVVEQKPASSPREALDRAFAKVEAKGKEPAKPVDAKPETKVEPKAEQPRGDGGKFAPKEATQPQTALQVEAKPAQATEQQAKPTSYAEAPKGYSEAAKAEWANTPEAVRGDIHRRQGELEKGINQYREVVEPLKPYLDLTRQHNTTLPKVLDQYMGLERALKSPDMGQKNAALADVFHHAGINPRDWAAQLLNQSPDQVQSEQDSTIRELRAQIGRLEQQIGGVTQTVQQQREQATLAEINKFAADHPRFEELADDIAFFMKAGRTSDLSEAYELAERLNPAPLAQLATKQEPVIPAQPAAEVQPKGSKSISGAPSQGSNPAAKRPPAKSNREALDRAFASIR